MVSLSWFPLEEFLYEEGARHTGQRTSAESQLLVSNNPPNATGLQELS